MATTTKSFIETQFPVSKLSKESYKERKANHGQTLTGLGKWWGRKPLVLVRACILGLLMPASEDPRRDRQVFLQLMTMDEDGLCRRYFASPKQLAQKDVYELLSPTERTRFFGGSTARFQTGLTEAERNEAHRLAFGRLGYDEKLEYCVRPEDILGPSEEAWNCINDHLGTRATTLQELVAELGQRRFGRLPRVGDAFCGGGSIPFEAACLGCQAYGSDLNPIAALLTWAGIHIIGGGADVRSRVQATLRAVYQDVQEHVDGWGIERNEFGWVADAFLYCSEVKDPETGWRVPLAPSWVIGERTRTCAELVPEPSTKSFDIRIVQGARDEQMTAAKSVEATWRDGIRCPVDRNGNLLAPNQRLATRVDELRGPAGLRRWENGDVVPRPDDVYQERLYCIRWEIPRPSVVLQQDQDGLPCDGTIEGFRQFLSEEQWSVLEQMRKSNWVSEDEAYFAWSDKTRRRALSKGEVEQVERLALQVAVRKMALKMLDAAVPERLYRSVTDGDLEREARVLTLLHERFTDWQANGFIPSLPIEPGAKTDEPIRTRGYTYWHHLFNPRQLLLLGQFNESSARLSTSSEELVGCLLGVGKLVDWCSRLCRWDSSAANEKGAQTYSNQALNTLLTYTARPLKRLKTTWFYEITEVPDLTCTVSCLDARDVQWMADCWLTDPPYADAINYAELSEFFIAWSAGLVDQAVAGWPQDSRRALAVRGSGDDFKRAMVDCYANLNAHTSESGYQLVMFTHTSAEVWADLALIVWAAGLHVVAAWTIATETEASGLKQGNYVQGTVNLVLQRREGNQTAWRSDVLPEIQEEVQRQLDAMLALEDAEDPNFTDSDLQLAAYAAALRVLTRYSRIEDLDVQKELQRLQPQANVVRERGKEKNPIVELIDEAVRIASNYLVPKGIERQLWRSLRPVERLYVKGLEVESHGDYRNGVYMEFARGFGVRDYRALLADAKANQTRLKTPEEFGTRDLRGGDFADTLLRQVLFAIHKTAEDEDPRPGRDWLRQEVSGYWDLRQNIVGLLDYLAQTPTSAMEHWKEDVFAALLLKGMVENDSV